MGLRLKTDIQRDAGDRQMRIQQHLLGARDSTPDKVFVGARAGAGAKLGHEVHAGQAGHIGHVVERDGRVEGGFDIVGDTVEPPRRQGALAFGSVP